MGGVVEIVIVTYRPPPGTLALAVRSVVDSVEADVRVSVVDNGGAAHSSLGESVESVDVAVVVRSVDNRGFGAAANTGIFEAIDRGADVVVVLNDDVEVEADWLAPLLSEFDDPAVGAVQPLLVSSSGERVDSAGVDIDRFGAGRDRLRGALVADVGSEAVDLAVFTGGAIAFRREFVDDVGAFDERFFLYYEDVELARRGVRAGWRYRLAATSRVRHAGSATTSTMGDDIVRMRERNRLWSSAMCGSSGELASAVWLSVRRLRHRPRRAHAAGMAQGLVGAVPRLARRASRRLRAR